MHTIAKRKAKAKMWWEKNKKKRKKAAGHA